MSDSTYALAARQVSAECELVLDRLQAEGSLSGQSWPRVVESAARFSQFAQRSGGVGSFRDVSAGLADAFVRSVTSEGAPSVQTMHLRRSVLRLLFRTARELRLMESDPTVDLVLPPRSGLKTRPLTDVEVALCRSASLHSLTATRLAAAWALVEASARTAELGHVRIGDVDLDRGVVMLPGSPRVDQRTVALSEWGSTQLARHVRRTGGRSDRPVVYEGANGSDYHRQAASCTAVADVFRRAALSGESDVRPLSVVAWTGQQILARTGRIDAVAAGLGIRSLDRAARLIDWEWQAASLEAEWPAVG